MSPTLVNFEEADAYRRAINDPITRELVGLVFSDLIKKYLSGDRPIGAFDMLFFVKSIEESCASHQLLAGLLRGESLLWPEENANEAQHPPLSEFDRHELERRSNLLDAEPAKVVSWEDVKSRAMARFEK
jgi:putative addiction module component (TIGR02574 family)